jgi:hypothetical protein
MYSRSQDMGRIKDYVKRLRSITQKVRIVLDLLHRIVNMGKNSICNISKKLREISDVPMIKMYLG